MYISRASAYIGPEDADTKLRRQLSAILQSCGKDRKSVARTMRISLAKLNSWCSTAIEIIGNNRKGERIEARRPRFPAAQLLLFCQATGNDELRLFFLSERQRHLLELGEQAERLVLTASRKRKKE